MILQMCSCWVWGLTNILYKWARKDCKETVILSVFMSMVMLKVLEWPLVMIIWRFSVIKKQICYYMLWHYLQVYWAPCQNKLPGEIRHKRQISEWIDSSKFRQFNTKASKQKHITHHNIFAELNLLDKHTIHLQILESRYLFIYVLSVSYLEKTWNYAIINF